LPVNLFFTYRILSFNLFLLFRDQLPNISKNSVEYIRSLIDEMSRLSIHFSLIANQVHTDRASNRQFGIHLLAFHGIFLLNQLGKLFLMNINVSNNSFFSVSLILSSFFRFK
jgi:hypothetical protein